MYITGAKLYTQVDESACSKLPKDDIGAHSLVLSGGQGL